MLPISELSIFFYMSHDCITCDSDMCDYLMTYMTIIYDITLHSLSKSKMIEMKMRKIK